MKSTQARFGKNTGRITHKREGAAGMERSEEFTEKMMVFCQWLKQFTEQEKISMLALLHNSIMEGRTAQECRRGMCAN